MLTAPSTNELLYTGQVNAGTSGLFATADNSNAIITLNRHSGNYDSQLGFSSNGNIYYRKFSAAAINDTQAWVQVYHSENIIPSADLDADTMHLSVSQDITGHKEFQDSIQARFGNDNDMLIQHTGSHGYWDCETGNMYIRAEANDSHIYLQADDGSGGNTTYIDINGNNERITMMKPVKMDQRRFALTTSTDGDHQGDVVFFGGTSTTVGKIYYYTSSGTWAETNAHAAATADGLLAVALGSSSDTDGMLLRGMVTLNHDPGTIGDPIYLDEANNGQAHSSIPAGTGDIVRVVGYCVHNTQGRIWFNPDNTFVEVA